MSRNIYDIKIKKMDNYEEVDKFLKIFLESYNWTLSNENDGVYQLGSNVTDVARYFKYNISDENVHIEAWIKILGNENEFGEGSSNPALRKTAADINEMLHLLSVQFGQIQFDTNNLTEANVEQNINSNQNVNYGIVEHVEKEPEKQKENINRSVSIGFAISIISFILSIVSFEFDFLLIIVGMVLGIKGIKSSKKGLAIATIVLSSLSLIIFIITLIATALNY